MSKSGLRLPRRRYLSSFRTRSDRPTRKFGEVPDDLVPNHEPCGALTIEPGIGTDAPRRAVVGATAEYQTEGEALRFEMSQGNQCGARPECARTISCREECTDDNVGIERRFKGFIK